MPSEYKITVGGLITKENKMLLIKRGHEPGLGKWSVPAGRLESNEMLEEALKREIHEETSLNVEVDKLILIRQSINEDANFLAFYFKCKVLNGGLKAGSDSTNAGFFSIEEASKLDLTKTPMQLWNAAKSSDVVFVKENGVEKKDFLK
jgi:8-oxo-dGTP diphosphatase